MANFSRSLGSYSTKAPFTQIRISFTCKWPIFLHEYGLPCFVVLSQSLRYLWRIFLAAWEATQQRPSSHKSEYLLHVNGLYFYTNTAFVHTKSVSLTQKPHLFENASEWFMAASTLIQIEKYAVSKVSGFVWSRSKF